MKPDAIYSFKSQDEPEVSGVKWHHESAKWFLQKSLETSDRTERFRLQMAGVYFARAIVEIRCDRLGKQGFKKEDVENYLEKQAAFLSLGKENQDS